VATKKSTISNKRPLPDLKRGKGGAIVLVGIDFPKKAGLEKATEDFLRMGDKWVGPNGTRMLYSEALPHDKFREQVIALLSWHFGQKNTEQADSDHREAFDQAVETLRERFLRLPYPGQEFSNSGGPIYAALIDHHGMQVDPEDLNINGIGNALYQCKLLREEIEEAEEKLRSEDEGDDEDFEDEDEDDEDDDEDEDED